MKKIIFKLKKLIKTRDKKLKKEKLWKKLVKILNFKNQKILKF